MSKFIEIEGSTKELFDDLISKADLFPKVRIKLLGSSKQKEIFKVVKANEIVKYLTENDVVVIINDEIFDQLEDDQQMLVAEESIAGISYNHDKDKLEIRTPDVKTFSGILRKYSYEKYNVVQESIKTLYDVKNNKGEESSEPQTV